MTQHRRQTPSSTDADDANARRAARRGSRDCCSPTTCRACPRTSATAGRPPARPPASPTASSTTGPAPAWSSPSSGRRDRLGQPAALQLPRHPGAQGRQAAARHRGLAAEIRAAVDAPARARRRRPGPDHPDERRRQVYECTSADEVIDLVQGGQGVFGIAVGRVWREVEGSLAELPGERADEPASPTMPSRTGTTSSPRGAGPARPADAPPLARTRRRRQPLR